MIIVTDHTNIRNLLLYHKEYLENKEDLNYAEQGYKEVMRGGKNTHDVPHLARAGGGLFTQSHPPAIRTIERKIPRDFLKRGYIDLRGQKINNVQELADILQIYRNPKFETFRVIYLKENKIVAVDGITSKLPGVCCVFEDNNEAIGIYKMKQKMKRVEADGYYITHNHPSGNVMPSREDIRATDGLATMVSGFQGHIIIDHTKYAFIKKNMEWQEYPISQEFQVDVFETATLKNPLLNETISSADQLANVMKLLQQTNQTATVFYLSSQLKINEVQEISNQLIRNDNNFANYIKNEMLRTGSRTGALCTKDWGIYTKTTEMIKTSHFMDVLYFTETGFTSARESGVEQERDMIFAGIHESDLPIFRVKEDPKMVSHFLVLIQKRRQFKNGDPGGVWLNLPATKEQLQEVMGILDITQENPEDFFVNGHVPSEEDPVDLPLTLTQDANFDELNFLAARLQHLDAEGIEKLNAIIHSDFCPQSLVGLLDYPDNTDCFVHIPQAYNITELGQYYLHDSGLVQMPDAWKQGIDTSDFGSNAAASENGCFTQDGYIKQVSQWQTVYEHIGVPEQYQIRGHLQAPAPDKPDQCKLPGFSTFMAGQNKKNRTVTYDQCKPDALQPAMKPKNEMEL